LINLRGTIIFDRCIDRENVALIELPEPDSTLVNVLAHFDGRQVRGDIFHAERGVR
jgi:hypothetical protein